MLNAKEIEDLKRVSIPASQILSQLEEEEEVMMEFELPTELKEMDEEEETLAALDREIAASRASAELVVAEVPQEKPEAQTQEEGIKEQAMKLLRGIPGAPSEKELEVLRTKYNGDIYLLALGPKDVYIFTYLSKTIWDKVQELVKTKAATQPNANPEEMLKEHVIAHAVKWPKITPQFIAESKAGILNTLFDAVMMNSFFLNSQMIATLTQVL